MIMMCNKYLYTEYKIHQIVGAQLVVLSQNSNNHLFA